MSPPPLGVCVLLVLSLITVVVVVAYPILVVHLCEFFFQKKVVCGVAGVAGNVQRAHLPQTRLQCLDFVD